MKEDKINQSFLVKNYEVNQSSLSRFLDGQRTLPSRSILSLIPFVLKLETPKTID